MNTLRVTMLAAALASLPMAASAAQPFAPAASGAAEVVHAEKSLVWVPKRAHQMARLRVVGPNGFLHEQEFGSKAPSFDLALRPQMADGLYRYEIVLAREPGEALARELDAVKSEDGTIDAGLRERLSGLGEVHSGSFSVAGGSIVVPTLKEAPLAAKYFTHPEDVSIQSSLCVGVDCTSAESFGFDTIRLKENNLRIKFEDTSVSPFPTTDWQITANDSASGGANKFSIEDVTAARVPFTIEGGATTNSLFIDSTGRVGFRTSTPVLDLHANTSNTPGIRLEQNNSGGFTAQTWDVAGNEANFFIRDVTGGSLLSFRIRPGAPTNSLDIGSTGNVSMGRAATTSGPRLNATYPFGKADVTARSGLWLGSNDASNMSILNFYGVGGANQGLRRWGLQTQEIGVANSGSIVLQEFGGLVGVGTVPKAWTGATPVALQLRQAGVSANSNGTSSYFSTNGYFDGATWRTINAGDVSLLALDGGSHRFYSATGGGAGAAAAITEKMRITLAGDVGIGTATPLAKLHVEGNARINGALVVTGACCGPDYVFDPGFKLASIEENSAYMWRNRHLPAVGPAKVTEDGRAVVNVFAQSNGMLEELEKAHIYIEQLNNQIKTLKDQAATRDAELRAELAELRKLLRAKSAAQ